MKTKNFYNPILAVLLGTLSLVSCGPKIAGTYVGTESYSDGGETYSTRVTLEVDEPNEDDEIEATFVSTDGTHAMSGKMDSDEAIESVRLKVNKAAKSNSQQQAQNTNQNNNQGSNTNSQGSSNSKKKTSKKDSKNEDEETDEEESEEDSKDNNVMANGPSNSNNQENTSDQKRSCEVVYTGRLKIKDDVIKGTLTASGGPCQREATSRYIEVEREND